MWHLPRRAGRLSPARSNTGAALASGCTRRPRRSALTRTAWPTRPQPSALGHRTLVVLATVEDAEDRYHQALVVDGVGEHGAPLVVRKPEAGPDVVTGHAPVREARQTFAGVDHGAAVVPRNRRRGPSCDVQVERFELVAGLGRVDDLVGCQAFADAFLWAAARRALTALAATAREGSAFSLS